ncbi:broad specificity polyphosphatase/5'/3'-nucleotidase SurE [Catenulispora sp. MAP5-51]
MAPVHAALPVLCQTWKSTAMVVIWAPKLEQSWLIHRRRKAGDSRSGAVSASDPLNLDPTRTASIRRAPIRHAMRGPPSAVR